MLSANHCRTARGALASLLLVVSSGDAAARLTRPCSIHQPEQSDRDQRDPDDEQHDEGRRPESDANDEQNRQRKDNEENRK